jgi:plasmid stabilization system protein ParE
MTYTVITLPCAERDFQKAYDWIAERSPRGAASWADAFYKALKTLERNPQVCGFAPENDDHDAELRQLIFKTRQGHRYRAIFTIQGHRVYVLHIRGPGQDIMTADEIQKPQ